MVELDLTRELYFGRGGNWVLYVYELLLYRLRGLLFFTSEVLINVEGLSYLYTSNDICRQQHGIF